MEKQTNITILQLNDTHAYLEPHQEMFWESGTTIYRPAGGFAKIAGYLKQLRKEQKGVLALDCGDTFHGTYPAVASKGEVMVPVLNELSLAAMTAHWEFAYGPEQFRKLTAMLNYPMLAINVYEKATDKLVFAPYTLKEVNGLKIGIVGIACNIVDKTMPPHFSEGIYFTLGNEELPGYIQKLKQEEKVDLIVLISHLGFPQNMKLLSEVEGVNICLSSHTHYRTSKAVQQGQTIVIESGCHGSYLGRLDLTIQNCSISNYKHELVEVSDKIPDDAHMLELVQQAVRPYKQELSQKVGETATVLDRNNILESTMDNFLLQSMLHATGAELAFSNGWRYGAPIVTGSVTLNDLYNIIPMNPPIQTVELTGQELQDMLEENLEKTFSPDPYAQQGGFVKRCMSLRAFIKIEAPKGTRIQKLFVNDEELDLQRSYKASFVTEQGVPEKYGTNRSDSGIKAIEAMQQYLEKYSPVRADMLGTFTAV
ncbi:bifunctional metallophosphatase/5'-nucleotidase [Pontibacter akesuensis]|uniref:2',3'-cyclic-nucleotide 2'-phosphodiesterase/5'-or 3'-nucleotidase, 5'-nucleotidase family n=1 Tax=Pontibacter akesuensis TaxID=388950 RepID=A0A1I7KPP0_9BACT|nr:bifunctional metallophosphatase/5'-nucleotidase [Pontibacter akesuensis]GHA81625.1 bifunctional metallophosphatase/5'-nucleotidase [Pontibacter akesuensis]SFU99398.1 2',3'-cyclic-nucleotide 2'-phosphodiesterase/5'-or 3'-nucleotidase, 5'-nucleotidase family [Pontibacter akesuensis]